MPGDIVKTIPGDGVPPCLIVNRVIPRFTNTEVMGPLQHTIKRARNVSSTCKTHNQPPITLPSPQNTKAPLCTRPFKSPCCVTTYWLKFNLAKGATVHKCKVATLSGSAARFSLSSMAGKSASEATDNRFNDLRFSRPHGRVSGNWPSSNSDLCDPRTPVHSGRNDWPCEVSS